jgi:hypothetical protein
MKPSSIVLEKTYLFRDRSPVRSEEWGERLWKLLRLHVSIEVTGGLRDRESYEYMTDRLVNFVLARLVVRGIQIQNQAPTEEIRFEKWTEAVSDVLDVPPPVRDDVVWHLSKICPRAASAAGTSLKTHQRDKVTEFARRHSHRCYICGQYLEYDEYASDDSDEEAKAQFEMRRFEIDHLFPQGRGGGRSPRNLGACCNSCNRYKDSLLSYADFIVENAIMTSSSAESVAKTFGGKTRFALLWRQQGTCALCDKKFHDADDERLYLFRRNPEDSYHFLNVDIACGPCADQQRAPRGVLLRE